jgi:hypothetical protein
LLVGSLSLLQFHKMLAGGSKQAFILDVSEPVQPRRLDPIRDADQELPKTHLGIVLAQLSQDLQEFLACSGIHGSFSPTGVG